MQNADSQHMIQILAVAIPAVILYVLPCFIAFRRKHRNRTAILVTNLFVGWTFIGWVVALIWASTSNVEPSTAPQSGQATAASR